MITKLVLPARPKLMRNRGFKYLLTLFAAGIVVVTSIVFYASFSYGIGGLRHQVTSETSKYSAINVGVQYLANHEELTSKINNYKEDEKNGKTFKGVSFTYNLALASEIKCKEAPAFPLEQSSDKPDNVAPAHISCSFVNPFTSKDQSTYLKHAEINVYPVIEYKEAFVVSKDITEAFEKDIEALEKILSDEPASVSSEIPILPWLDASQSFRAQIKYLNFKNGKGVIFLTQYNDEPSIINNEGLSYLFQGITDDRLYYISAKFPVTSPILPEDFEATNYEGYHLPSPFYKDYQRNKQNYEKYLNNVKMKLDALPRNDYQPKLGLFDDLISSLYVKDNN